MPRPQRDLRRTQRKPKRQAAWIRHGANDTLIPCVIWDLSDEGARLASARLNILPDLFTLLLTKDGKSCRLCRVAWRKKPHLGVRFVDPAEAGADLDASCPTQWREAVASRYCAPRAAHSLDSGLNSLSLQVHRSDSTSGACRRPLAHSSIAFGLLVLLLVATAVFYVAGLQIDDGTPWALEVCDNAKNFCEHPEFSGVPAVLMAVVYLAAKGMEL
jgi:hypothetical protein